MLFLVLMTTAHNLDSRMEGSRRPGLLATSCRPAAAVLLDLILPIAAHQVRRWLCSHCESRYEKEKESLLLHFTVTVYVYRGRARAGARRERNKTGTGEAVETGAAKRRHAISIALFRTIALFRSMLMILMRIPQGPQGLELPPGLSARGCEGASARPREPRGMPIMIIYVLRKR